MDRRGVPTARAPTASIGTRPAGGRRETSGSRPPQLNAAAFRREVGPGDDTHPAHAASAPDLRRPPITLAELERARTQLSAKGHAQPSEELIFATTGAQRRIEREAAQRSRRARRNLARHPLRVKAPGPPAREPAVNYNERVIPYSGEVW